MLLTEIGKIENGRIFTKDDSLFECPHCKSIFEKNFAKDKMKKWGKDKQMFYTTKHCPNCDRRILMKDQNKDVLQRKIERLRQYANQCRITGDLEEHREALKEIANLEAEFRSLIDNLTIKDAAAVALKGLGEVRKQMKDGSLMEKYKGYEIWSTFGGVNIKDDRGKVFNIASSGDLQGAILKAKSKIDKLQMMEAGGPFPISNDSKPTAKDKLLKDLDSLRKDMKRTKDAGKVEVKRQSDIGSNRWGIYVNGKLVEGGFFSKEVAEETASKNYGGAKDTALRSLDSLKRSVKRKTKDENEEEGLYYYKQWRVYGNNGKWTATRKFLGKTGSPGRGEVKITAKSFEEAKSKIDDYIRQLGHDKKTKDINPPSESERIKNDFESGRKDDRKITKDVWIDEYKGYKIIVNEFGSTTFEFTIQKNGKDVYKGVKETLLGARATARRLIDQNKVSDSKTKDKKIKDGTRHYHVEKYANEKYYVEDPEGGDETGPFPSGIMAQIEMDKRNDEYEKKHAYKYNIKDKKTKDVILSPKDTYNKIRNFDKIALQGFARRIGYPELSDLKKMDTSSIIAELISFLHGEKGDQFLENPNNFKDSKPTAKDKMLKDLDSLKRRVEDAMSYKVKDAWLYKVQVGNTGGWSFPSFSEALSYAKSMAVQNNTVVRIYPLHSADNKIRVINEKGQVAGFEITRDTFGMNTEEQQKEFDTRNIEEETIKNNAFRRVVFTGNTLQLVLMSLLPNEDIGMEVHDNVDQFFRIEEGEGLLEIEGQGSQPVKAGFSILITAGTKHNVKNIGSEPLKLYTIYGPPNHPADRLQNTKAEAIEAEKVAVGDKKTKDQENYKVYWVNHNYYSQEEFNTLEEARKYADSKSFEYRIDLNGRPVASGGSLRGFRMIDKKTKDVNYKSKLMELKGRLLEQRTGGASAIEIRNTLEEIKEVESIIRNNSSKDSKTRDYVSSSDMYSVGFKLVKSEINGEGVEMDWFIHPKIKDHHFLLRDDKEGILIGQGSSPGGGIITTVSTPMAVFNFLKNYI